MKDGFVKIALASPKIRLADTDYNATECIRAAKEACENGGYEPKMFHFVPGTGEKMVETLVSMLDEIH